MAGDEGQERVTLTPRMLGSTIASILHEKTAQILTPKQPEGSPPPVELSAGDVLRVLGEIPAEKRPQVEAATQKFVQRTQEIGAAYAPKVAEKAEAGLTFLDRIAEVIVDPNNGKQKGYLLQTALDFVGIPTVASAGDVMGALRGYLDIRSGHPVKGVAELLTAIAPGIPTGPAHFIIEQASNAIKSRAPVPPPGGESKS